MIWQLCAFNEQLSVNFFFLEPNQVSYCELIAKQSLKAVRLDHLEPAFVCGLWGGGFELQTNVTLGT